MQWKGKRMRTRMDNLPKAFVDKIHHLLGEEAKSFFDTYQEPPFYGLRVNTLKLRVEDFIRLSPFHLEKIPWIQEGFYTLSEEQPGKHPYHAAGLYYIQEPSAMAPAVLLDVKPGEKVLDLCAAPGGKASQLAAALKGEGLLVANEIHPSRVKILGENLERLGVTNAVITNESPDRLIETFESFFDKILVDAPCSGEGMFRKNPEACYEWHESSPQECSIRQLDILNAAAKMLKPGGYLVYSTCTFSPEENEGTLDRFLRKNQEFHVVEGNAGEFFDRAVPEWVGGLQEIRNAYRLWPHKIKGEGHFMALLRKGQETENQASAVKSKTDSASKEIRFFREFAEEYLHGLDYCNLMLKNTHLYHIPPHLPDLGRIRVLRPGIYLGEITRNRFVPGHSLAMVLHPKDVKQCWNFSSRDERVIAYLKGMELKDAEGKGWGIVAVDGYSLGWGKASNGVLKNHYPKGLRWK